MKVQIVDLLIQFVVFFDLFLEHLYALVQRSLKAGVFLGQRVDSLSSPLDTYVQRRVAAGQIPDSLDRGD